MIVYIKRLRRRYNCLKVMKMRLGIFRNTVLGLSVFGVALLAGCADAGKPHSDNLRALERQPKNVIILIADGGGFNHFRADDYYECNQIPCRPCERFPVRLAMSTYPVGGEYNAKVAWCSFDYVENGATDSAAAATAMATGVKTYNAGLGVDVNGSPVLNLLERAEQLGKATGVVTSVPFSHATPAGFVIHNGDRNNYTQIAEDMVKRSAADVIMGCGHPLYNADGKLTGTSHYNYIGADVWARLKAGTAGGDANGDGIPDHWTLVQTRAEFQTLAAGLTPKRVFGIAQVYKTLQEDRSGNAFAAPYEVPLTQTVPTLEGMTVAALNVLDEDPNGFFVMIEGGAVDWAAHANYSGRLIEEMNDFNRSIDVVINWVRWNSNWGETLVIITADHETGYLTGPGSGQLPEGPACGELVEPVWNELVGNGIGNLPTMEWHSGSHTNSLVPFFAKGRGAQLFEDTIDGYDPVRGPYFDNTDIANVIFLLWHSD
ncbi:MAG: alkaline phosphatase [Sedimentisphaerales bacterium]|nr:alkaline phosphatase [Sedimentisphaerales bacterium]